MFDLLWAVSKASRLAKENVASAGYWDEMKNFSTSILSQGLSFVKNEEFKFLNHMYEVRRIENSWY